MIASLGNFLGFKKVRGHNTLPSKTEKPSESTPDISTIVPTSPKPENYIGFYDFDQIISTQTELIERITITLGFDNAMKQTLILNVIRAFLSRVHLMPASESHHHSEFGGLFRHSLEVAFYGLNLSTANVFGIDKGQSQRNVSSTVYPYAVFIAGLFHDLGKAYYDIRLIGKNSKKEFNPFIETIYEFEAEHSDTELSVRFFQQRIYAFHERVGATTFLSLLPFEAIEFLTGNGVSKYIITDLIAALTPIKVDEKTYGRDARAIQDLVNKADQISVKRYLLGSLALFGSPGRPLDKMNLYIQLINLCLEIRSIKVNEAGGSIFLHKQDFVFLVPTESFLSEMAKLINEIGAQLPVTEKSVIEFFEKDKLPARSVGHKALTKLSIKFPEFSVSVSGFLLPRDKFSTGLDEYDLSNVPPITSETKDDIKSKEVEKQKSEPSQVQKPEASLDNQPSHTNQNIAKPDKKEVVNHTATEEVPLKPAETIKNEKPKSSFQNSDLDFNSKPKSEVKAEKKPALNVTQMLDNAPSETKKGADTKRTVDFGWRDAAPSSTTEPKKASKPSQEKTGKQNKVKHPTSKPVNRKTKPQDPFEFFSGISPEPEERDNASEIKATIVQMLSSNDESGVRPHDMYQLLKSEYGLSVKDSNALLEGISELRQSKFYLAQGIKL